MTIGLSSSGYSSECRWKEKKTGGRRKGEATHGGALMDDYGDVYDKTQDLSQMRCETTSPGVRECALCASSAYHVHHASVCVNVVIGVLVVLCELHVTVRVHVIPLYGAVVIAKNFLCLEVNSLQLVMRSQYEACVCEAPRDTASPRFI